MNTLLAYLNGLKTSDQAAFAKRCGTSIGYLRKAISTGQRLGEKLCIAIERESSGAVRCEELRSDVDWSYLRGTARAGESHPPGEPEHSRRSPLPQFGQGANSAQGTAARASTGGIDNAANSPTAAATATGVATMKATVTDLEAA